MIKAHIFLFLLIISYNSKAQYYYKDIVVNKQAFVEINQLREQKIKTINVKSYEEDGVPSDGFFCVKNINKNYTSIEMKTKSNVTGASVFTAYYNPKGFLLKTIDSSAITVNISDYEYNKKDQVVRIYSVIRSGDDDFINEIKEEHLYQYNDKDLLTKMTRVKNIFDSSTILFSVDEKNNISIEKDSKSGNSYYYYYDNKDRLTDVVHLNKFNQQMLPDYIFEYNSAGLISQMITTEEGSSYYYIWKYLYDNGLRVKEKCYSKEKRLMGTIEYEYK